MLGILFAGCLCCLLATIVALIALRKKYHGVQDEMEIFRRESNEESARLSKRIQALSKYEQCIDADAHAKEILSAAQSNAEKVLNEANLESQRLIGDAKSQAYAIESEAKSHADREKAEIEADKTETKRTLSEAKSKASQIMDQAVEVSRLRIDDALRKAGGIVSDAEAKARAIAGDAYDIARNAEAYRQVVSAMKNIIEGYGDKYLKPLDSVLDELAAQYEFTDAGRELTQAREVTRQMIAANLAAKCDYVERSRHDTAVAFVLDAFNGKMDSILSLIKKDNYGTLEQKAKDAYALVNFLGEAFRNARITPEYLDARLAELRWGVAVIALQAKDKEEQRAIKERMREEERARREYERAMKEAAKEEATIRKAMEKARAEMEKANEAQKEKYETMLAELSDRLAEAEAKNQRALSMAQQTRSGHVYIISNVGSFGENVYKIGMTRRLEPADRVRELGDASVPFPFDIHAMIYSEDAPALETALHKKFMRNQLNKVNPRKEFFALNIAEIKKEIESRNIEVSWTLVAEAAQYRESKALEASMSNADVAQQWEATQAEEMQTEDADEDAD